MTRHMAKRLEDEIVAGLRRLAFETESLQLLRCREEDGNQTEIQVPDCFHASEVRLKGDAVEIRFYDRYRAIELLLAIIRNTGGAQTGSGLQEALKLGARALAQQAAGEDTNDAV